MHHTLARIDSKHYDYKFCKDCGTINWYENKVCQGCGGFRFYKNGKKVYKWVVEEYDYLLNDRGYTFKEAMDKETDV